MGNSPIDKKLEELRLAIEFLSHFNREHNTSFLPRLNDEEPPDILALDKEDRTLGIEITEAGGNLKSDISYNSRPKNGEDGCASDLSSQKAFEKAIQDKIQKYVPKGVNCKDFILLLDDSLSLFLSPYNNFDPRENLEESLQKIKKKWGKTKFPLKGIYILSEKWIQSSEGRYVRTHDLVVSVIKDCFDPEKDFTIWEYS